MIISSYYSVNYPFYYTIQYDDPVRLGDSENLSRSLFTKFTLLRLVNLIFNERVLVKQYAFIGWKIRVLGNVDGNLSAA